MNTDNGASSYRRYLSGDESAFDEILKEYSDGLIYFINRFVNDVEAAEDIAIDTLLQLVIHKHRYNFKTSLKTYLYMMAKSRALNYIKHRKRLGEIPLGSVEYELADDSAELEERVLADERSRVLNRAMQTLPEDMKTCVHLIYFENMSYDEAAKIMGKSRKQIDNLLYRAKQALRKEIGEEGKLLL